MRHTLAIAPLLVVAPLWLALAASPCAAAEYALVLTNNKSLGLGRPDLQYADDDGAKWLELFDSLYGPDHATLLTRFDAPTRARFPELSDRVAPPTRAAFSDALAALATRLAQEPTGSRVVTLVFAGHGDVADGEGFLELEDARLTATELAAHLASLPADRIHLVIDACNAWFMLHPRKPGARLVVRDVSAYGDGILERDPRVGALLSTSAEATTWEWSEIQSGLFSHAARSGLRGGADVDRDRRVTYRELDGFMAIANESVPERYRPRLFVRAPAAAPSEALVELDARPARAPRLELPSARRVAIFDERGVRILDGHFEPGAPLALVLPEGGLILDEAVGVGDRMHKRSLRVGADAPSIGLAPPESAGSEDDALASRGDVLRIEQLFATPFGRDAFERWAAAPPRPEIPYGVSHDDAERLGHVLRSAARLERRSRRFGGVALVGLAVPTAAVGIGLLGRDGDNEQALGGVLLGTAGLGVVMGAIALAVPAELEDLDASYLAAPKGTELERAVTVARFERLLAESADDYRVTRQWTAGLTIGIGVVSLAAGTLIALDRKRIDVETGLLLGSGAFFGALGAYSFTAKHQVEEVWDLYQDLRALPWKAGTPPPLSPVLAPVEGGLVLGVNGGF